MGVKRLLSLHTIYRNNLHKLIQKFIVNEAYFKEHSWRSLKISDLLEEKDFIYLLDNAKKQKKLKKY